MINGVEDADGTVDLVAGYNVITVEVTAQDGTTKQTYTVTVLRAAPEDDSMSTDDTITSLLSRLDVELTETVVNDYHNQTAGYDYDESDSFGELSPAGFNYPAGFGPWYTVESLIFSQEGDPDDIEVEILELDVRGAATSVTGTGTSDVHILPADADITLHLEGDDFTWSASLDDASRTNDACVEGDGSTRRRCRVGETKTERYKWDADELTLLPTLADGDKVIVRLRYSAPRPGTPGRPLVTAPEGKSGALVVTWTAPANDDPKVRGYEVLVSPAPGEMGASGAIKTTGGSTTRLPVLLLDPDTAYDVRVRARSGLATGPWSDTVRATTNPLEGTNNPVVTLDLDGVTKLKVGERLYKRLKVTGMNNLHADAFPEWFEGYYQGNFVEFRVLGGIHDSYEYEDLTRGEGEGAFYAGALTIDEDGEVYHDFGYEVIAEGRAEGEKGTGAPGYGPLYLWLERTTGGVQIGSTTANSRETALCVEIADDSDSVPVGRECPSPEESEESPEGSPGHAVQRITARFNDVPRSHDGESEFTVRLAFVKDMGISPTSLREDALAATGGAVTQVQRVDDRSDLFEITVEPDSDEDVTVTLSSSGDCGESGAVCTQEEDPRQLYNSPTATVAGPILTASFQGLPSQHDGETAFSFRIAFSHEIATDAADFRDHSLEVWGGEVTRAEPVGQRRDLWEVEVEPASEDSVMVSLKPTWSCAATGAVCTAGGRLLSVIPATMVPGPATWPVQITGVAQVGKTLTADSSNLSERYGVQVTSMTYRWLANGARVPGANAQTYRPDDDKQGKRISVMATYTDDRGNEETVTSGPTEPLAARDRIRRATGLPVISGRALVGHTLTADKSLIIDANGLENAVFYYFWEADDDSIPEATGTTYTPVAADVGKVITVIVAYVDDSGRGQSMTSPATLPVMTEEAAAAAAFAVSLRYVANADGSVTLHWNAPDNEVTGYRILRSRHTLGEREILVYVSDTGSTATTFTDTGLVAGVPHSYRVQAIRDGELGERTKTFKTKVFPLRKPTNSPATGAPAISGTAQVGETLTADISGIADEDGLENVTKDYLWAAIGSSGVIGSKYAYQWLSDGAEIEDATGYNYTTYTLTEDDVGKAMSVRVTFVDDAGYQETLTSAATDPVAPLPQPNSPARGAPTIGGTAQVGETLTADTSGVTDEDGLDDSTFTVQWVREDSVMVASAAGSYTPTDGDRGKSVKVRVSFTDDAGNPETRTSPQTAAVEASTNSAGICDRTAQVRETILDQLPDTSDCAAVTDTDLSGITRLALSEKGITTLKSGDFSGLSNLRHLNLADNELSALPDGIFDDLTGLQELSLFDNRISRLPDNIFDNLSGLQSLRLSGNGLSELPGGAFDYLSGLQSLGLGDNGLSELPGGTFDNLTELQSLGLGDNSLSELPDDAFDNLTELQSLDLGNNELSELPGGIFDNLTRLRTLKLSYNDLSELPDGIFDNLTELETLYLHWNRLSELPDGIFDNLTALSSLELSNNELSELPDGLFDDLSELQFLHLSDNELSVLPDGAFDSLTKLWSLSVGGNELSGLHEDVFVNLAGLQSLDLNNNELSELADGLFDGLSELHSLHLNGNDLSELPDGIFDNLTKLRTLSVDYNGLSELPDSVFDNLSELWGLSLIGNELSELPDGMFDNLANLKQLYLFSNKLSELPDRIFYGLASLDVLNIDENTGSPFTFTVELERPDENTIALKVAQATPFDMEVTLSAEGGSLSSATVTIPAGNVSSEQITVSPNGAEPVAISVVSAAFLLGEFQQARGIQTGLGEHLTLGEDWDTDTPATGTPTISGAAQVGETLTADTSGITDADGLSNATFIYQWLGSRDTEVQGAASATYTLVAEDEGKTIKVRVTFTDDAGNNETLTSAPTAVVAAAPPPPPDNVHAVTQKSGAVELTWDAPDGATVTGYGIERRPAGGQGSGPQRSHGQPRDHHTLVEDTGSAETGYTDESAERGVEYEYRVTARNESGPGEGSDWVRAGPATASNSPATGAPTISGTTQVGQTLTADITGISDADGLSGETFAYQWVSSDGTTDTDITDITDIERATGSTFTLVAVDQGKAIKVRVTFTDDGGNEETLTSAPTKPVFGYGLPGAPRNLAATPGNKEITLSWEPPADNGNAPPTRYRIEWRVDGKDYDKNHWGTARSTTYTTNDQANLANGVKYFFRVKAENDDGNSYGPYGPASGEVSATPTSGSAVDLGTPVLSDTENLHHRMVRLDWQDIEDAGWYVVQYYHIEDGEWLDLPAEGMDIAFHGSSAVVSNLHGLSWLRVRAMSCAGESEWSQIEQLFGTNKSDWEGVPVPDVEEGDEIEPCPVVLGTPVLSDTETLHHGIVRLDWQDIEDAGWYVVQYYHLEGGEWLDLPAEGVDIAFHGSSAVVSNLDGLSWLRVRAMSCAGESEWSQIEQLFGTNASDWEDVPVPDVAEGDEIEPCSEDADTPGNSPATGAPTISGTAQVGETLTANTARVADADGLSNVQYEYQWLADDSDISGVTNATYTLVADDEGKAVTVQVSFTDDEGHEETLTSEATDPVKVATTTLNETASEPKAYITVVIAAGDDTVSWSDPDECTSDYNTYLKVTSGPGTGTKTRIHIGSVASGSTEATQTITYSWTSDSSRPSGVELELYCGSFDASSRQNVLIASTDLATRYRALREGTYSSAPLTALGISSGTLSPAFDRGENTYTAEVPNDVEVITLDPTVLTGYQTDFVRNPGWGVLAACGRGCNYSYGNGTTTGIVLADADEETEGFQINLNRGENRLGIGVNKGNVDAGPGRLYDLTVTVQNSPATGAPTITGTAQVGETLMANTTGIADADGLSSVQYEYQWLADDSDISGATSLTYTLADTDEGKAIKVEVTFTDDEGHEETLTSTATDAVSAAPAANSPATGVPTISGTAQVGETLMANTTGVADADGLSNVQYEYQWLASRDTEIQGATGSSYTVQAADEGKTISVQVSFTDDGGNAETLTSGATDAVSAAPTPNSPATGAPTINGTAQVGETLTANTTGGRRRGRA